MKFDDNIHNTVNKEFNFVKLLKRNEKDQNYFLSITI